MEMICSQTLEHLEILQKNSFKMRFLIFFLFLLLGCGGVSNTKSAKHIIIPQYFYNYNLWSKVIYADINGYVIINPSDGPGDNTDSAYLNEIDDLIENGKIPIGYISTRWGSRDTKDIMLDIDKWIELYPNIKGFFLDEVTSLNEWVSFYENIIKYIHSKGEYRVVINPGTMPESLYFSLADLVVVFEGDVKNMPADVCEKYSDKSAIIVYGADYIQMRKVLYKPCLYLYVTDDNDSNPFDTLPSYFDEEIELLK